MRRAARTDENQAEIVAALRKIGVSVTPTHAIGAGFPDLVCGHRGHTRLLEIKNRDGDLTEDQCKFVLSWRGDYHVVRSVREALAVFGVQT